MKTQRIEHSRRVQMGLNKLIAGRSMQWLWSLVYFLACLESTYSHLALFQEKEILRQAVSVLSDFGFLFLAIRAAIVVLADDDKKKLLPLAVAAVICFAGLLTTGNTFYIKAIVLVVASSGMELRSILKASLVSLISAFILGTLSIMFVGLDVIDIRTLGYSQKNQAGLAVFLICAQYVLLEFSYWPRSWGHKTYIVLCVAAVTSVLIGSKTSVISIAILILGIVVLDIVRRVRSEGGRFVQHVSGVYSTCMLFSVLTAVFLPFGGVLFTLDHLMTNRVWLNWYALNNRPISLFGSNVDITAESGTVYSFVTDTYNNAITIDNTYIISIILMGVLPTIVFCILHYVVMRHLCKRGWSICVLIGVILCIYGLMESQILDPVLNFILMIPFSAIARPKHLSQ